MALETGNGLRVALLVGLTYFCDLSAGPGCRAQEAIPNTHQERQTVQSRALETEQTKGIAFPVNFTAEILGNLSGGRRQTAIWESLLIAGLEVDFEKTSGVPGLSLTLSGLYGQGTGLTDKAVGDFNTLSNIDTYDSIRLYEAWLQQEFNHGQFSIRIGQLLADAEFFASEYGALFVNSSFGAIPIISQNFVPPIFPVAAPGVRLRLQPSASFYGEIALFSGDVGDPAGNNKHNTRFSFNGDDGALIFAEVGYATDQHDTDDQAEHSARPKGLAGSYKLGGCYDSGHFQAHDGLAAHQGNFSIYSVVDQELWHPDFTSGSLSGFLRVGVAPSDRNTVTVYCDTGLNYQGVLSGRPQDLLGLGFSYTRLSDELRDDDGREFPEHYEAILEFTYRAALTDHLSLQPDLQFIFNPGAVDSAPTAVVAGLRFNLKF